MSKHKDRWMDALEAEYNALVKNNTWEEIDFNRIPKSASIHRPIWRFKIKDDGRFKARLCFDGRHQTWGVDYMDTYAPVARIESVRLIIAIALSKGAYIELGDVPNAFLNSKVDADVYMYQPEGFRNGNKAYKLLKGLYGLKQAARLWYLDINAYLIEIGFTKSEVDECIFIKKWDDKNFMFILLYVDDLLVMTNSMEKMDKLFTLLKNRFDIRRMGPLTSYLGVQCEFAKDRLMVHMTQPLTIMKLLHRMKLTGCAPVKTAYNLNVQICADENEKKVDKTKYRSALGLLLWIARCCRPDIGFIVNLLSRYQSNPTVTHWGAIRHVCRYLAGTLNHGITIGPFDEEITFQVFSDSSYADPQIKLRNTTGCIVLLDQSPILWMSCQQRLTTLSVGEAEYVAAGDSVKQGLWITNLILSIVKHVKTCIKLPFNLRLDSKASIDIIKKGSPSSGRTRHVDVKVHFIIDRFKENQLTIEWVPSKQNLADILTKRISSYPLFKSLRDALVSVQGSVGN
jgi:hypothetical protein